MLLDGRNLVITGVLTPASIAFDAARVAQEEGANVVLTSFGKAMGLTVRTARRLPDPPDVLELDINDPSHVERLREDLTSRWGRVDGILHAIAFAPNDALGGAFLDTPWESASFAFQTSAYSLKALTVGLLPLMKEHGGGVVSMDFDAQVAWPVYDWMGVSKAALESITRYLARYLGQFNIRVNCVSAGPVRTMAARSIPGFDLLAQGWAMRAPLKWDVKDPEPVAKTIAFLLSDWARMITGEIVHVDGGYHAMGAEIVEHLVMGGTPVGGGSSEGEEG
jgi:meromycolic acid enoyl-[acyl-carrier-protein] reductase